VLAEVDVLTEVGEAGITIRIASVKTGKPVLGREFNVVIPIVLIVSHLSPK
jgi:hypothetical protein